MRSKFINNLLGGELARDVYHSLFPKWTRPHLLKVYERVREFNKSSTERGYKGEVTTEAQATLLEERLLFEKCERERVALVTSSVAI